MTPTISKARLALWIPFESGHQLGFALPVFQSEAGQYLVQTVDEYSGKVDGFATLEKIGSGMIRAQSSLELSIGEDPLYSFKNNDGAWHVGTLPDLRAELMRSYNSCPEHVFLNLQIAELIGTDDMRRNSRALVYRAVAQSAGYAAARALLTATLRHALWGSLMNGAADQQAANKLILRRRKIISEANLEESGLLPGALWDEIDPLLSVPKGDIIDQLANERALGEASLHSGSITIFTLDDNGGMKILHGSTPVDVAYLIHTQLGDEAVGAKINGRTVPLRTPLKEGDRLEILRSKAQSAQPQWLSFVHTHYAYQQICKSISRRSHAAESAPVKAF